MSYTPTMWVDGETPVNAENLNKLEQAVQDNDTAITEINTARENGEFDGKSAYEYAKDGGYTGTEADFAKKLSEDIPEALPNPYPLTINGKTYDGSKAVDITVTGGATNENIPLGQTPITLTQSANIRLVGDGEYSYTVKGKTVADISTAAISKNNAEITEHEGYIELSTASNGNWYDAYVILTFSGLSVGEKYLLAVEGLGLDSANLVYNGYMQIRNANGSELGRYTDDSASLTTVEFTADTSSIDVRWYPANNYYWGSGHRTARIGDIYLNKASDGTDRTGVINESGTFTDSYSFGQLAKGITITSDPSCEVYSVSGGGGGSSGESSAPLEGKTVVCFGDSLFGMYTGDTSAPAFVAKKTGATVHNVGFSGCRMSEHPYTSHNPFSMYALANAVAHNDWSLQDANAASGSANFPDQLAILKSIDFNKVDYIVIHYGTNDFAAGAGVAIDNASNPKATNTLCGALRHSVETLLGVFPKLKIFVSLPAFRYWTADNGTITYSDEKKNVNGNTLPEFVKALAETAKEYNLPVIDSYYGLGINKSNASTFLADGTHHNIEGRKRLGEYIGAKLISEGDIFRGADSETGGSGGSGGASIDVTASVGQTIVVEEVDANGKPTKWKAADFPMGAKIYTVAEIEQMTMAELVAEYDKHPIIVREYVSTTGLTVCVSVLLSYDGFKFGGVGLGRDGIAAQVTVSDQGADLPVLVNLKRVFIPTFDESYPSAGVVYFTGDGFETNANADGAGAFMMVDLTQLTDGAVITIDAEEYMSALNRYQQTASVALAGIDASGNVCFIPALYLSTNENYYPIVAKILSPTTGDIITVTLVPGT